MHRFTWPVVAVVVSLAVAASVGVASATAGGANSANAKLCQKGGWMSLVRSDDSGFNNQGECVSYGAHGGTLLPKPTSTCTAGSEDFSADAEGSQPTTFAGGTIDGPYAGGAVLIQGGSWAGFFAPPGTHVLWNGLSAGPFRLTFTNPVASVQLDAQSNFHDSETQTLTAYDSSDTVVDTDAVTADSAVTPLSVTSTTKNIIQYVTIESTDDAGFGFTNIVWSCAA